MSRVIARFYRIIGYDAPLDYEGPRLGDVVGYLTRANRVELFPHQGRAPVVRSGDDKYDACRAGYTELYRNDTASECWPVGSGLGKGVDE